MRLASGIRPLRRLLDDGVKVGLGVDGSSSADAASLWLAARIEHALGDRAGLSSYGAQLRSRFPEARETGLYNEGRFR
jgi:cytosine/adenosine deaminase-related metal-dependent hydrolase